jgi:ATP-dependent RNA helicase DDX31/DBP7
VPGCIVGGEKRKSEKARIRKGLNIIIATPGRLVDHFENTASLGVSRVKWLVLDEADRLMEMGFSANVHTIVSLLDREKVLERRRRNVLLSATLSKAVTELSGSTLHKPLFIDASTAESGKVGSETRGGGPPSAVSQTPSQLDQYCVVVPAKLRLVCLAACLKQLCFESKQKVIVFMISKRSVEFHHHLYSNALDEDLPLYELHGSMDQEERRRVHKSFSQTTTGALLCTDVAARGLDLPEVDWIIQHSPPCQLSDYIHRVGRTARAGAVGKSLLFLLPHEAEFVQVLNKEQGVRMNSKGLEELLRTLKDPKNPKKSVENAATQLQVRFERFVLSSEDNHAQAKSAYHSFVCGYSTYESSLKHIFHTKALHYGHIAKSFALRESPSAILPQQDQQSFKTGSTRASQTKLKSSVTENNMDEYFGGFVVGPRVKQRKHH